MTHHVDRSVRQQYCHLLLEEYRKYYDIRINAEQTDDHAQFVHDDNLGLASVFRELLYTVFPSLHPWPLSTEQKER